MKHEKLECGIGKTEQKTVEDEEIIITFVIVKIIFFNYIPK